VLLSLRPQTRLESIDASLSPDDRTMRWGLRGLQSLKVHTRFSWAAESVPIICAPQIISPAVDWGTPLFPSPEFEHRKSPAVTLTEKVVTMNRFWSSRAAKWWKFAQRREVSPYLLTGPSVEEGDAFLDLYENSFAGSALRTACALVRLRVRPQLARCWVDVDLLETPILPPPSPLRVLTSSLSVTSPLIVWCHEQMAQHRRHEMAAVARDAQPTEVEAVSSVVRALHSFRLVLPLHTTTPSSRLFSGLLYE